LELKKHGSEVIVSAVEYVIRVWDRKDVTKGTTARYSDASLILEENIYRKDSQNVASALKSHKSVVVANAGPCSMRMMQTKRCESGKVAEMTLLFFLTAPESGASPFPSSSILLLNSSFHSGPCDSLYLDGEGVRAERA